MCTQITLVAVCDISSVIMPSVMELLSLVACTSVGGIMVSIAAFQAVDPGSIPGRRNFLSHIRIRTWVGGDKWMHFNVIIRIDLVHVLI